MRTKHGLGILLALAGSLFVSQQAVAWGCQPRVSAVKAFEDTLSPNKYLGISNMKTFGDEAVEDFLTYLDLSLEPQDQLSLRYAEMNSFSSTDGNFKWARHALRAGAHLDGLIANIRSRLYVAGLYYRGRTVRLECEINFDWGYFNQCVESSIRSCEIMDRGILPADLEKKIETELDLKAETGMKPRSNH